MSGGITITEMLRANGVAEANLDRAEAVVALLIRRGVPDAAFIVARTAAAGALSSRDMAALEGRMTVGEFRRAFEEIHRGEESA